MVAQIQIETFTSDCHTNHLQTSTIFPIDSAGEKKIFLKNDCKIVSQFLILRVMVYIAKGNGEDGKILQRN